MKKAEDYLIDLWDAPRNELQIYVTLNPDIELIKKAIKQAQRDAIEACVERARVDTKEYFQSTDEEKMNGTDIYLNSDDDCPSQLVVVDKQSILSLLNEIQ